MFLTPQQHTTSVLMCLQLLVTASTLYLQPHLKGFKLIHGRDPNLLGYAESIISLLLRPRIMPHLQELAQLNLAHKLFKCLKRKKYRVKSRTMHWTHYVFLFLFVDYSSWHYYVTMPMPASTFTIAVGSWTEMKPEICSSNDVATERSFSPSEADFRFVLVNLRKNKHLREQYDAFIPSTGNVSHSC